MQSQFSDKKTQQHDKNHPSIFTIDLSSLQEYHIIHVKVP